MTSNLVDHKLPPDPSPSEDPLPGALTDCYNGRIPDLPLYRDRIKVCAHLFGLAHALEAIPTPHDAVQDSRGDKDTQSSFAESAQ